MVLQTVTNGTIGILFLFRKVVDNPLLPWETWDNLSKKDLAITKLLNL